MTLPHSHDTQPEADALDRAFSAYFKAQIPATWPHAPQVPQTLPSEHISRGAGAPSRGRLTLAASVAALLLLGLSLSSDMRFAAPNGAPAVSDVDAKAATAKGPALPVPDNTPMR